MMDQNSKKQFEVGKALQYGMAVMNTAAGVTGALAAVPFGPQNIVMAAAVAAAGAAQIATIARQQFKSPSQGAGVGGLGGGSSNNSPNAGSQVYAPRSQVNVTLMGESGYTADQMRGFIALLNSGAGDNMNIQVSNR
jgi:hypothetical protein